MRISVKIRLFSFLFFLCGMGMLSAQAWTPPHQKFPPNAYRSDQYDSSPQNWSFAQDDRGVMYIGNSSGILEYDGRTWKMVEGTTDGFMDRLAKGQNGRIYAGGDKDFGYIGSDSSGKPILVNLVERIPEDQRDFEDLKGIRVNSNGIYFLYKNQVIRYFQDSLYSLTPPTAIHRGYTVEDRIYLRPPVSKAKNQILEIKGNDFLPAPWQPGIEKSTIFGILQNPNEGLFFVTRKSGLVWYQNGQFSPYENPTQPLFESLKPFCYSLFEQGFFAVGTLNGGLLILNEEGKVVHQYTQENFLENNTIYNVCNDRNGALWAALSKGLTRINHFSAFKTSGERNGVTGIVRSVLPVGKQVFTSGSNGVYTIPEKGAPNQFSPKGTTHRYSEISVDGWNLSSIKDKVLVASQSGTYLISSDKAQLFSAGGTNALIHSRVHPDRVYIAKNNGLVSVQINDQVDNVKEVLLEPFDTEFAQIEEDQDGNLWLSADQGSALYYVKIPTSETDTLELIEFTSNGGGIQDKIAWILPYFIQNKIYFGTTNGVFEYSAALDSIVPSPDFSDYFVNGTHEARNLAMGPKGRIWISSGTQFGPMIRNENNQYDWDSTQMSRIAPTDIWSIYPDSNGIVYLGTTDGVIRYNPALRDTLPYVSLVRKVTLGKDSVVFHGNYHDPAGVPTTVQPDYMKPIFDKAPVNLTFEYQAVTYEGSSELLYSYQLENYDDDWSEWGNEIKILYTNIPSGTYTFRVKARNIYEQVSEEGVFQFTVTPPWYATIIAFVMYGLLAILLVYVIVRLNARRLRKKNLALEATIQDRTQEIRHQKNQLETTNVQLSEAKDRAEQSEKFMEQFLANMSHEIRTPMNAVMGMTHLLLDTRLNDRQQKYLNTIKYASDNLLVIINDILDLTKIEVGQMTLEEIPFRLLKVADGVVNTVNLKAEEKGLRLIVDYDENLPAVIKGDPFRLNQILLNLVNNSVKFTEAGYVRLALRLLDKEFETVEGEEVTKAFIRFQVEDTGIGIPEDKLGDIFQSFKQASAETTRKFGGTGLGLTISRHLVELQEGAIDVDSEEGEGTTFGFNLWFPVGTVEQLEQEAAADEAEISGDLPPIKLLLVDDDAFNREVGQETLRNWHPGIEIEMAENGREAFEKVGQFGYDIILMDMQMPEMDGMEATQAIRTQLNSPHSETPIIALTAHASRKERERCLAGGMNEYLTKPFNPKELFRSILRLLPEEVRNAPPVPRPEATPDPEQITPVISEPNRETPATQWLDLEMLQNISGNDPKRMAKFLDMFARLSAEEWTRIQTGVAAEDWDEMRAAAHKLKGKSGYLGVQKLKDLMEQIEKFEHPETERETLTTLLSEAEIVLTGTQSEIEQLNLG